VTPLYPQKLALTSPTGGGRSVGIVRSRTKATECLGTTTAASALAGGLERTLDAVRYGFKHIRWGKFSYTICASCR